MSILIELPLLLGELAALWWSYRRSGFLIFPHALVIYLIVGQFVLWLNAMHLVENAFLAGYSSYQFETHLPSFTLLLLGFGAISMGVTPPVEKHVAFKLPAVSSTAIHLLTGVLYARAVIHFALIDKHALWTNREYMLLSSTKLIAGPAFIAQTQPIWALIVAATFFYLMFGERRRLALPLLPLFIWECWFEIASHSRMAFVMFGVGAFIAFMQRRRYVASMSLGVASALLLLNALAGRAQTEQGLSSIFFVPATVGAITTQDIVTGLNNLCEGMFDSSEYSSGAYYFPTAYKVLSLSPLPSFIDGFDVVNRRYAIGLASYVPMSAVQELVNFGAGYAFVYYVTLFLAGRVSAIALQRRPGVLSLMANALVTLGAIVQLAYPVRNSFRFYILSIAIVGVMHVASKPAAKRRRISIARTRPIGRRPLRRERTPSERIGSLSTDLAGLRIGLLTAWASPANGGVFEAVVRQSALIRANGGDVRVFALDEPLAAGARARFGDVPVHLARVVGPARIGWAPALGRALTAAALDLLHLQGIWMATSAAAARWARRTGRPLIVSPHGMLDPWITARGRLKKAAARTAYERASWRRAAALHALTDDEAADIARETGRIDAVVIPNAGPLPGAPGAGRPASFLYLGRLHPKKNRPARLAAGATLPGHDAELVIAGWGEPAHVAEVTAAIARAGPRVRFVGAVEGDAKAQLLAQARFAVLPSLSEGLPMAVLEAWAAGTPAIMTQGCHLPEGFATGAALRCGTDPVTIASALRRAVAMSEGEWRRRQAAALALAAGPFAPATVAARWAEAYRMVLR